MKSGVKIVSETVAEWLCAPEEPVIVKVYVPGAPVPVLTCRLEFPEPLLIEF